MEKRIHIGLVGDFNEKMYTHVALNKAIEHCRPHLSFKIETPWIPTETLSNHLFNNQSFDGFWLVPGSPYKNDAGVYDLIRWARENNLPFLGTCGGLQYMVVEYARNVLGIKNVGHEESEPDAEKLVVSKLSCSLKGKHEEITITDKHSWLYSILQKEKFTGHFNCSYGVNTKYQDLINQHPMAFTAFSPDGEVRAIELKTHRFFAGTLFQPPLDSSEENPNPLLMSFFNKCAQR